MAVPDPREVQIRELHREAQKTEKLATRQREQRDRLILQLRRSDPTRYTYGKLASIAKCSPELIALIVRNANR